jgi:protoporphyrin/coproporphyrin ferrochelatase
MPLAPNAEKTAILYVNLGTPDAPDAPAVRRYLREFLGDPRVVEIPPLVWKPILHGFILPFRPAKSAAKYKTVWLPEGSPLKVWTERQAKRLQGWLGEHGQPVAVRYAMRYGNPSIDSQLDALMNEGYGRILVLPAYPQYSATTTASVIDAVAGWSRRQRNLPELRWVARYPGDRGYLRALAQRIRTHWEKNGRADHLVLSFHGIPERSIRLGDPYQAECMRTAAGLAEWLQLAPGSYTVTFQSRFGRAKWLEPYTEPTLVAMAKKGVKSVDVACPGFVADCLETLEEIDQEAREAFLHAGGKSFNYIPCLNDDTAWIGALGELARRHLGGWEG